MKCFLQQLFDTCRTFLRAIQCFWYFVVCYEVCVILINRICLIVGNDHPVSVCQVYVIFQLLLFFVSDVDSVLHEDIRKWLLSASIDDFSSEVIKYVVRSKLKNNLSISVVARDVMNYSILTTFEQRIQSSYLGMKVFLYVLLLYLAL